MTGESIRIDVVYNGIELETVSSYFQDRQGTPSAGILLRPGDDDSAVRRANFRTTLRDINDCLFGVGAVIEDRTTE
jgi:hypothetical protein